MSAAVSDAVLSSIETQTPEQIVHDVLEHVSRLRASDLYFAADKDQVAVSIRHLGLMRPLVRLPLDLGHRCIAHIKVYADMDVAERRRPQDGRWLHHGGPARSICASARCRPCTAKIAPFACSYKVCTC